jgi:WD40 repeat protein
LWDAATGRRVHALAGHSAGLTDSRFTPDGRRLLTAGNDGVVLSWDVATGRELALPLSMADADHRDAYNVPVRMIDLAPDGRQLVTLSEDADFPEGATRRRELCVVRVWQLETRSMRELYRGQDRLTSVAFADGGATVLAAGSRPDGRAAAGTFVAMWDLSAPQPASRVLLDFNDRPEGVWAAIEAGDGHGVLTVGGNGASQWDPANTERPLRVFKPHSGVTAAGFSADGQRVVTGSSDHRAKIWNAQTGKVERLLPAEHSRALTTVLFSPADENVVLSASLDGTARLWDVAAGSVKFVLEHGSPVHQAIFSPDGRLVLTMGEDGLARVWQAADGQPAGDPISPGAAVRSAAYSPDGQWLLLGLKNGEARLYDATTRLEVVRFGGHTGAVQSVAFSPDMHRVLTGSEDRLVKLWDIPPSEDRQPANPFRDDKSKPAQAAGNEIHWGTELLTLVHHDQGVSSVAFSPDGRTILSAGFDGSAVLWLSDDWKTPDTNE